MRLSASADMRYFRLCDGGVQCCEDGLFVGSAPLLSRSLLADGEEAWVVRPTDQLEDELGACYGLPIDITAKLDGLSGVARAMGRGEMALAQMATVLLGFPDPPSLAKDAAAHGSFELAAQLFWSGLLKGGWDPAKHPRTGEPPNPGQFAPKDGANLPAVSKPTLPKEGESKPPTETEQTLEARAPKGLWSDLKPELRLYIRACMVSFDVLEAAQEGAETIRQGLEAMRKSIETNIMFLEITAKLPGAIIEARQRARDEVLASLDPPKTLVELQTPPTENVLGYDRHHIVHQNDDNVAKSPGEVRVEKFGRNLIDSPSNLVWIPRLKHQLITGYYNSEVDGVLRRQAVGAGDFAAQREEGLQTLQRFGVLK